MEGGHGKEIWALEKNRTGDIVDLPKDRTRQMKMGVYSLAETKWKSGQV